MEDASPDLLACDCEDNWVCGFEVDCAGAVDELGAAESAAPSFWGGEAVEDDPNFARRLLRIWTQSKRGNDLAVLYR